MSHEDIEDIEVGSVVDDSNIEYVDADCGYCGRHILAEKGSWVAVFCGERDCQAQFYKMTMDEVNKSVESRKNDFRCSNCGFLLHLDNLFFDVKEKRFQLHRKKYCTSCISRILGIPQEDWKKEMERWDEIEAIENESKEFRKLIVSKKNLVSWKEVQMYNKDGEEKN